MSQSPTNCVNVYMVKKFLGGSWWWVVGIQPRVVALEFGPKNP